jgi:hypothetical protein
MPHARLQWRFGWRERAPAVRLGGATRELRLRCPQRAAASPRPDADGTLPICREAPASWLCVPVYTALAVGDTVVCYTGTGINVY